MPNRNQRNKLCRDLAAYFIEKGKVMTQEEYLDQTDKPVLLSGIRNVARNYASAIKKMHAQNPDLLTLINKRKEEKAPKPAPKVKPAIKPAVKEDKDDK